MPQRNDLKSILIIGSGPIVIGQACEFDYSGTQATKALREKGIRVILVNSNPATIMTDPELADATYIEPLTVPVLEKIIKKEKPDAILPTVGGQTALNLALALHKEGVLEKYNVELIGAKVEAIRKAEDRELFKLAMEKLDIRVAKSFMVSDMEAARKAKDEIGFPIIIRPAFTLGGTGGGTCYDESEFEEIAQKGLSASPISQVLVEESVMGWKEFELEVMRDLADNVVIICSIENLDPMGVHTGDSITVAPQQTLSDKEYQRLRDMSIDIIREIGVETGGSNIQFAVNPENGDVIVIEMNPRVSRSSALASKATGFPIAKIAALLSIGYTLDEIRNDITRVTPASFEPSIDYVVTKIPRFAFEKFPGSDPTLGVQMKAVGEAMAIGRNFKESFQKALRSLETDRFGFGSDGYLKELLEWESVPKEERKTWLTAKVKRPTDKRIFYVKMAFDFGMSVEEIFDICKIDPWFLYQFEELYQLENRYRKEGKAIIEEMKKSGFSNRQLAFLTKEEQILSQVRSGAAIEITKAKVEKTLREEEEAIEKYLEDKKINPVYKRIDTCAGEFEAFTPYMYSSYDEEDEAEVTSKKKVMILGGGPNRIGQGIEFDYCCCHASFSLQEAGVESIMVNSNPETVSTDYDTSDRLYFEPLSLEDVMAIFKKEKPDGVIVQLGGQTPLKLAKALEKRGVPIMGTSPDSIDRAEDRKRFAEVLEKLNLKSPDNGIAASKDKAREIARKIGYPVLVRPSYVLGGRAMLIVNEESELDKYMEEAEEVSEDRPLLVDSFLQDAIEVDVDALCDGKDVFIAGIMEHIEEAGIHSGDSACVLPPQTISQRMLQEIEEATYRLALELDVKGLINVQYAIKEETLYVLEVNPRASRTVPFVAKSIGIPVVKIAVRLMLGEPLSSFKLGKRFSAPMITVKEAVLPFSKFPGVDTILGPEMRSTGEVMGVATTKGEAFVKAQIMAGEEPPKHGTVFVTINDKTKKELLEPVRSLSNLGYNIIATEGTHKFLSDNGILSSKINKIYDGYFPNVIDYIKEKKIHLIINTPLSRVTRENAFTIRQAAIKYKVPCLTTAQAGKALIHGLVEMKDRGFSVNSLQEIHAKHKKN
ncbi:carbamoyl-phosphate synthase large subunit [Leptospira congkakensis]|uniref:Carbamoyl phosphate synthase large chain n=1 Tax=Leptospira congkakensis TaxID=2484932 RepID=A0A4Z1AES8_9LEPT|nr:carbamoyl-phosphate synthase large subunit [Leptospira congkakensis]TGL90935.1 carbamoyl-phosphate synthase large subunit [Leptospira congkakensis]TGL91944.1 carbamoyl-phosphate synthase large subunit [Leptospira congkakensis]TGL98995.1 carbamoyl-phosphate synthase large subunit [Leptospira congkakensis]